MTNLIPVSIKGGLVGRMDPNRPKPKPEERYEGYCFVQLPNGTDWFHRSEITTISEEEFATKMKGLQHDYLSAPHFPLGSPSKPEGALSLR